MTLGVLGVYEPPAVRRPHRAAGVPTRLREGSA